MHVIIQNNRTQRLHGEAVSRQLQAVAARQSRLCGIRVQMDHLPPTCPESEPLRYNGCVRAATIAQHLLQLP